MPQIRCENGQLSLNVYTLTMPGNQSRHDKSMTQVMWPHTSRHANVEPGPCASLVETRIKPALAQTPSSEIQKKGGRVGPWVSCVACLGIKPQYRARGWVNRNEPILVKFGLADMQQSSVKIDITAVQAQRLARAQPCTGDETDQRVQRLATNRMARRTIPRSLQ
jgi:hypothetical protein